MNQKIEKNQDFRQQLFIKNTKTSWKCSMEQKVSKKFSSCSMTCYYDFEVVQKNYETWKWSRFRAAQFRAPLFRAPQFRAKLSKFRLNEQESEEPRTQGSTADRG